MTIVVNEWMPERPRSNIKGFFKCKDLIEFLIAGVLLKKTMLDGFFESRTGSNK